MRKVLILLMIFTVLLPILATAESYGTIASRNFNVKQKFSIKFKFDFPATLLNISNETGFSYNLSKVRIINNGDIDAKIVLSYSVSPPNQNITATFEQNDFILPANSSVDVKVTISILPNTIAGDYNLTVFAKAVPYPTPSGNPITYSQSYKLRIFIGGKSYRLSIFLRHPDGTPAHGLVRVAYVFQGNKNYWFQSYGTNLTFFVVAGTYAIEVWFNSKKQAEETIVVDQNISIYIQFSTIHIENFQVLSSPKSRTDNLIFAFNLINDDPLIYQKIIEVRANLYSLDNKSFYILDVPLATVLIRGTTFENLIGSIAPLKGGWKNGTYRIEIIAYSKGVVMANYTQTIKIIVIERTLTLQQSIVPLLPLIFVALIAGLIGFIAAKKTTKIYKPVSKAPFKIRMIGVIAKGTLFSLYDFARKRMMLMSTIDREYPSFITLIRNIVSVQPTSWLLEEHLPLAWSDNRIKVMLYPINQEFILMIVTNPKVNERDINVVRKIRAIAGFVARIHEENKITYDYIMKRQREYLVHLRRIAEYVRKMKLA